MSKRIVLLIALLLGLGFIACSKKAESRPQFIFKPAPDKTSAAKILGQVVTYEELVKGVEGDIHDLEVKIHDIKMNRLRALVLKKLMESDPNSKGLSNDEYLDKYIAKNVKVSEKAINAFIKERKIPKEHLNDAMKTRVRQFLERDEKKKAVDEWMKKKTSSNPVEVYLKKPSRPVFDINIGENSPMAGGESAKVTVVEFSDFQCPFCAKGATVLTELKKKYGKKIKVVFKNFPLPFHNHAQLAAEAGLCAHEQSNDKFWKFHDVMFGDQTKLAKADLINSAKKLGLDMKKFSSCLDSKRYTAKVKADIEDGKAGGVKSTPTFFVNGKMVSGAQAVEVFAELIDEDLAK